MKLLNIGCGNVQPGPPWINIDSWVGGGEDRPNVMKADLRNPLPFDDGSCDGVFASHLLEHLDAQEARGLIERILKVLAPGGLLCIGVPNATYHRKVWPEDNRSNSMRLFGEIIDDGDIVSKNNMSRALFFSEHKQVLTEDSLWCHFVVSGFEANKVSVFTPFPQVPLEDERKIQFQSICNRIPFTLFMIGEK